MSVLSGGGVWECSIDLEIAVTMQLLIIIAMLEFRPSLNRASDLSRKIENPDFI